MAFFQLLKKLITKIFIKPVLNGLKASCAPGRNNLSTLESYLISLLSIFKLINSKSDIGLEEFWDEAW